MARQQSKNELKVLENVDLVAYYNDNIVPLGKKFKPIDEHHNAGLCPFHEDTDPSLHYWKKKKIFHCFGCHFGGDVVKTHRTLRRTYHGENLTIEQTIEILAKAYNIELDREEGYKLESPYARARYLQSEEAYKVPKDTVTLGEYTTLNKRVILAQMPVKSKVSNFQQLDVIISTHVHDA